MSTLPWSDLSHAYGSAEDTPEHLENLSGPEWEESLDELYASILHQGSVYPATLAALPYLVDVANDPAAKGRNGALWLLASYAESIDAGASRSDAYLPDGIDLDEFDRDARSGLTDAIRGILPLVDDPDPQVRADTYRCAVRLGDNPVVPEVVAALRGRFERERDAAAALAEPLIRLGAFESAWLDELLRRGDDAAVFAAAWTSVASGTELPAVVDHLVRLWPEHAENHDSDDTLEQLCSEAGAGAVETLRRLREAEAVPAEELADAWVRAAEVSRSAAEPAADALLTMIAQSPSKPMRLVDALWQVLPTVPDRTGNACDAIARLDVDGPKHNAAMATRLFIAADPRWARFARRAADADDPPMVRLGSRSTLFPLALLGAPARHGTAWAADDLLDIAKIAIAADSAVRYWVDAIITLPPSRAVVDTLIAAVPAAPLHACRYLAVLFTQWPELFDDGVRERFAETRSHAALAGEDAAWAKVLEALLLGTELREVFESAWRETGGDTGGDPELLALWARQGTPGVREVCLRQLGGVAGISIPDRGRQLVAARVIIEAGEGALACPTVLAIADKGGLPFEDAARLAAQISNVDSSVRREWIDLLRDIVRNGREDWSGRDYATDGCAIASLFDLGELAPADAADRLLSTLTTGIGRWQGRKVGEVVVSPLRRVIAAEPSLRDRVEERLRPLLESDTRLPAVGDPIEDDEFMRSSLRAVVG